MIVLGFTEEVRAQNRAWSVGVGVGYGPYWGRPGFGPYWAPGWGYGWGIMPNYYDGFWGNGLSMYGPPVPTGKPVPGVFGGGDSQFFGLPPLYPGWMYEVYVPLKRPATLPPAVIDELPRPGELLPPPAPLLDKPAAMEIEVRLPREDALVFIDGEATKSSGAVRTFATPVQERATTLTYDIRAEWKVDGLTTTHTKRVVGRPGERTVVEFK
jgi:uncharacterized protein (TIGR03000 family)